MIATTRTSGLLAASFFAATLAHGYENETLLEFPDQSPSLALYSSPRGSMTVSPPGSGGFKVQAGLTALVTTPGSGGIKTVITPSSQAVPTRIAFGDQRSSTYRNISAKCLNPGTLALEACDFGNTTLFPRTDNPLGGGTYSYPTKWDWYPDIGSFLQVWTPPYNLSNQQSNGGYITLPPYVREITVTAYGAGNTDFSYHSISFADAPSVSKAFAPSSISPGGTSALTILIKNPDLGGVVPNVNLTDVLPAPLKLISATHTCTGGTLNADTATGTITLSEATMPTAGCAINAQVQWPGDSAGVNSCKNTPTVTNRITPPQQFNTALGQLDTEATADLSCTYTPPTPKVSLVCTPAVIFDSANQVSTCTVTSDVQAGTSGLGVNLTLPASSPRYTTSCASPLVIPAGSSSATCTITATANTVAGDGDVVADLAIAAPNAPADYAITGSAAQVSVKDDDSTTPQPGTPAPVPTLTDWGLLLLSALTIGVAWVFTRRRVQ